MGDYRLSLCIPTYNFGPFIGETLQSIRRQITPQVQVVVLDGGSTDNTREVVEAYGRDMPGLRYTRQDMRGGIDRDISRVVGLSAGEYSWLFSSDDVIRPGAIRRVLQEIEGGCDLYLLGRMECTLRMRPIRKTPVLALGAETEFELSDEMDRSRYFSKAEGTYALFAYMSSLVFRKARWDAVPLDERYVGSCWAHVARIFAMIPKGLRVKYVSDALVWCRRDNDSFLSGSVARRMGLTVRGYQRMGREFFGGGSLEDLAIRRALRKEHRIWNLLALKAKARRSSDKEDLRQLRWEVGALYDGPPGSNAIGRLLYDLAPAFLLDPAYRIYKTLTSILGY